MWVQAAALSGVSRVLVANHASYANGLCENVSSLVVDLQADKKFSHIVTAATAFGKTFLPHAAAKLDVNPIGDVISIKAKDTFVRPIYAGPPFSRVRLLSAIYPVCVCAYVGNALATVKSADPLKLLTVRPTSFAAAPAATSSAPVSAFTASSAAPEQSKWVENRLSASDRPDLASAKVVVSGGRGLGSGENFKMLEEMADTLGGAVGASRAAVDAGFVPNDMQARIHPPLHAHVVLSILSGMA